MIENTSKRYGLSDLPMFGGSSEAIEAMEKRGQQQIVNSALLPTEGSDDPEFLRLGFKFGEPLADDPLFRPATLPEGWRKARTDHDMHSDILDQLGRRRVGVFYKAAFYDRRADMHLNTVFGYVSSALHDGTEPILDDEWATADAVAEAARGYIRREEESIELWQRPSSIERQPEYAAERVSEAQENILKAQALIARASTLDGGQ